MQIDVAAPIVGHHKAKALLVIEELDLALDHRAGGCAVAVMITATAAAEAVTTTKTITAAEAISAAAKVPARSSGRRFRRGGVDAVDADHLQAALAVRQVAHDGRARLHIAVTGRLKR